MATTRTNWKELYNDLPTHVAEALRAARLKPEHIITKEDGELMAIEGIKEADVNSIRAIYNADSVTVPEKTKETPKKKATKKEAKAELEAGTKNAEETEEVVEEVEEVKETKKSAPRKRSSKYKAMAKIVKSDELYSVKEAVEILSKLAKSTKLKTVELHLNMRELGLRGELKLPHSTGKDVKIAIFSDELAEKIAAGKIDFDMLLCTPADMAKLARYAKVLGPKGLMPNPKSGTVTEHPEERAKQLASGGTLPYKSESKFPIIHLSFGSITQNSDDLIDNINEALKSLNVNKIKSAYLSCTHTPSVKLSTSNI
jgi:large subunit ribosomal protein L1